MKVYVVESGDGYDFRYIVLVATSEESAHNAVKRRYSTPYVVEWSGLVSQDGRMLFYGDFERVEGKSTKHRAEFEITEFEVES